MHRARHGTLTNWLKVLAPVVASLAGLTALRLLGPDVVDQKEVRSWLDPLGEWAPVAFVFLAVRPVTLLPGQFFTAVGGLMFGTLWASVYALLGGMLGSAVIYMLSKKLGTRLMKRAVGNRYPALAKTAQENDFKFSFLVCINPLFPTDVAQAAAYASGARFWPVALGTMLGSVPGTWLTAQFGSAIGQGRTIRTTAAAIGLLLSLALGALLGRRLYRQVRANGASLAPSPAR